MAASLRLFFGSNRLSTVPFGNFAKAASVGAKTANGPLPLNVGARPVAFAADNSLLNCPALYAVSTMFAAFADNADTDKIKRLSLNS